MNEFLGNFNFIFNLNYNDFIFVQQYEVVVNTIIKNIGN